MQANDVDSINNQAREWFTLMQSGSVTVHERTALNQWLAEHPEHERAYASYEALWADLGQLKYSAEYNKLRAAQNSLLARCWAAITRPFQTQPQISWAVSFASILSIAVMFVWQSSSPVQTIDYATALGETKAITLEDGSKITLGAKTKIHSWISKSERHVDILEGQAFFVVAKNPQKPFIVLAGNTRVRVVGTQFDVRLGLDRTRVAVLEGIVAVSDNENSTTQVTLTAGQQTAQLPNRKLDAVQRISQTELESWRNGKLIYLRASLADVVADVNRYRQGSISLESAQLADLKVTAAVSTNQIDSLTDLLEKTLPIQIEKNADNSIVIRERH